MLPKFFRPPVLSLFVRSFVRSFDRSSDRSWFVRSFVRPNNLCSAVMLPEFRSFVRPIIRSFIRSFIVPIHCSSFVHTNEPPLLFNVLFTVTIHCYYSSSLLLITVTIHHRYYSSMISIVTVSSSLFIVTIHHYYSSIIRSPQISTTHPSCCPVHLRPARPIFQSYELR
jgi:hypothetical protein